ncbi:MAG: hypothetical protein ABIB43_04635 [archaeon]
MSNKLKEISYKLGLTKENRIELSDVMYETATVVDKDYEEEEDNLPLGTALDNMALGIAMSENEKYNVTFKGEKTHFSFDDEELFEMYKVGDIVTIGYKEKNKITSNYVPPNLNEKVDIETEFAGYQFVNVQKE